MTSLTFSTSSLHSEPSPVYGDAIYTDDSCPLGIFKRHVDIKGEAEITGGCDVWGRFRVVGVYVLFDVNMFVT